MKQSDQNIIAFCIAVIIFFVVAIVSGRKLRIPNDGILVANLIGGVALLLVFAFAIGGTVHG